MSKPLLLLTWRDHYTSGGWKEESEFEKQEPDINRSVGWLVAEDEHRLTIVQTIGSESVRDSLTLEKSCLEKRRELR